MSQKLGLNLLKLILFCSGVTMYSNAARLITTKKFSTAVASLLATEARHASWVAAAVNGNAGWSGALDVSAVELARLNIS